jgi:anthranilate/para-aminobenzoate synthase component I
LSAHDELRRESGPCVLLESTGPPGPRARLSILARRPRALLVADRTGATLFSAAGTRRVDAHPVAALRGLLREVPEGRWPDEGGVAGALAYDFARPRRAAAGPLLVAVAVDRFEVEEVVEAAGPPARGGATAGGIDLPAFSNMSRDDHRRRVLRVKEHIAAGDIYQANLSQRFELPFDRSGRELYGHLRRISPAPFSGYLRAAGIEIASASPERLLMVDGERAWTRPIAGTRPRAADPGWDRALAAELILSPKERAEHLMLVDLARNDLGKVAAIGSVGVDELMAVEEYAQVRHIVSNISARLLPGRDALDALLALFPGGTITGVPKIRCMQILDEVEPAPRGFYTGALFYATPSGRLDANILIRSAVVAGGKVTFQTGGGIVADSDPDAEYEETLHKAEGLRLALQATLDDEAVPLPTP